MIMIKSTYRETTGNYIEDNTSITYNSVKEAKDALLTDLMDLMDDLPSVYPELKVRVFDKQVLIYNSNILWEIHVFINIE